MNEDNALTAKSAKEETVALFPYTVEDEIFEVQVVHPYKFPLTWRPSSQNWRDRCGETPESTIYKITSSFDPSISNEPMMNAQKDGWIWTGPWTIDKVYTTCDVDGWTYGISISSMNNHIAEGTSKSKPKNLDFLRRRRWVRTRARSQMVSSLPTRYYRVLRLDSTLSHFIHGRATPMSKMHSLKFFTDDIAMEGWLGKYGSMSHNWRLRYFLLRSDTNTLVYLRDLKLSVQVGQMPITSHTVVEIIPSTSKAKNQFAFELVNGIQRCRLNAPNEATKLKWIQAIHGIMFKRQPPFAMKCSAMFRLRANYREECIIPHYEALVVLFTKARESILTAFDELMDQSTSGDNVVKFQFLLSQGLATTTNLLPPNAAVLSFRSEITEKLNRIQVDLILPLKDLASLSYLKINMAKEEVYEGCLAIFDSILSFQVKASKTVVKVKRPSSDLRRQSIPQMWLDDSSEKSCLQRNSTAEESSRRSSDPQICDKPISDDISTPKSAISSRNLKRSLRKLFDRPKHLDRGVNRLIVWAREDDIGSLIAYTLTSQKYVERLESSCKVINVLMELENRIISRTPVVYKEIKSTATHHLKCHVVLNQRATTDTGDDNDHDDDDTTVVVYFAPQFHCLRQVCKPGNLGFLDSIAKSASWETSGGKSGAFFSLSHDRQFVLKGVSASEFNMFVDFAPKYFEYMAKVAEKNQVTCLVKILGAYKIKLHGHARPMYVFAMECSTFGFSYSQLYDLKGVKRNRGVDSDVSVINSKVLPDENFMDRTPIHAQHGDLKRFRQALVSDTEFLCQNDVVDYSLLLAINDETLEIRAALIDYVHQFDFIKRVESGAKKMYNNQPTVIPPGPYRERFLDAMLRKYFASFESDLETDDEATVSRCHSDTIIHSPSMQIRPRAHSDGNQRNMNAIME